MEAKFTKGDWFLGVYSTILDVSAKDHGAIFSVECDYREYLIAPTDEQQANAHLIACAPDMYKELELCKGMLEAFHFNTGSIGAKSQAKSVDKLLAKARGDK